MGLSEFVRSINIKQELIPLGKRNRPGQRITPKKVTIHNTANKGKGANADRHSLFVRETGRYTHKGKIHWVSWHYTVDDLEVIQQLPEKELAYHAGSDANNTSIAIEICMHQEINQDAANDRAARLAAFILNQNGLEIGDLKTHKSWTNKNCPALLVSGNNWNEFVARVEEYMGILAGANIQGLDFSSTAFTFQGCLDGVEDE